MTRGKRNGNYIKTNRIFITHRCSSEKYIDSIHKDTKSYEVLNL